MRERGLPLSPMMARATLRAASPKTMTRRLISGVPAGVVSAAVITCSTDSKSDGEWRWLDSADLMEASVIGKPFRCPYGVPGDRLWGREAYRTLAKYDGLPPRDVPTTAPIWYEADGPAPPEFGRYRHARFMMRWMSRILREVTRVAVERLQDINDADAIAEGCPGGHGSIPGYGYAAQPTEQFYSLWESIHGKGSWNANPWVWVIGYGPV